MTDNVSELAPATTAVADDSTEQDMSPGSQLRRAREAAALSVQELARRLCMNPGKLELLERDEYDRLPSALYVRGYIRNLCKELKLDAEPVLQAFSGYCTAEVESRALVEHIRRGPVLQDKPKRGGYRGLTLLALVLVAGAFWWTSGRQLSAPEFTATIADELSGETGNALGGQAIDSAGAGAGDYQLEPGTAAVEAEPEAAEPELAEDFAPEPAADEPELAGEDEFARVDGALAGEPVEVVASEDTDTASPAGDTAQVATASGELELEFSEESWVEVSDATGKALLAKLQPAGSSVQLGGTPPYRVMLGNAVGATVRFRGEVVDSAPVGGRRTRKLTLGE